MLDEHLRRLIGRELEEIEALLDRSTPILNTPADAEPLFERVAALSIVLSSFYTGIERIFERIAGQLDPTKPQGERWHIELLNQLAHPTENRPAVISEESRQRLRDYLAFRHLSRHAYTHHFFWSGMSQLVVDLPHTWTTVRSEILQFIQRR
jgi:hypothetical protein